MREHCALFCDLEAFTECGSFSPIHLPQKSLITLQENVLQNHFHWRYLFSEEGARDASGKLLLPKDESERQLYLYTSLVMVSSFWIDQMCLDLESDSMIVMGSFQIEMFYESFIGSAEQHCLLSFLSCCFQTQCEQTAEARMKEEP